MISDKELEKLREQIAAWPMAQRFTMQRLLEEYLRNREDIRAYQATGLTPESVEALKLSTMGKAIADAKEFNGLLIDRLRELAAADKDGCVAVTRCKDCKYGEESDTHKYIICCSRGIAMEFDDFCSYGKPREG